MSRLRYQLRFTKQGPLRWISHRDLARLWERMVRRAGVRLAMSEGFSPKAKISFPTALALGIASEDEVVELELVEAIEPAELLRRLNADRSEGLRVTEACRVPETAAKAQFLRADYRLDPPPEAPFDAAQLGDRIRRVRAAGTITFSRKNKDVEARVDEQIARLEVEDGQLWMSLKASRTASLRPQNVLAALGLEELLEQGATLVRTRTELDRTLDPSACAQAAADSLGSRHRDR
jgi:radical SAM-linked protein